MDDLIILVASLVSSCLNKKKDDYSFYVRFNAIDGKQEFEIAAFYKLGNDDASSEIINISYQEFNKENLVRAMQDLNNY